MDKQRYLKVPCELGDGHNPTIEPATPEGLRQLSESLEIWAEEALVGESVEIELVEMTQAEFEALPEI